MRCQACQVSSTSAPDAPFCEPCAADWALSREGRFWERSLVVAEQGHALTSWWSDPAFVRYEAQAAKGRGWFGAAPASGPPPVVPDWKRRVRAREREDAARAPLEAARPEETPGEQETPEG